MVWFFGYRCLECGRWMHATCLKKHFDETGDDQKVITAGSHS